MAGPIARKLARKESVMSILRIAVDNHLSHARLTIRELLAAAYFKKYQKPMPSDSLNEDVRKWESGMHNIPYLYDFMLGAHYA